MEQLKGEFSATVRTDYCTSSSLLALLGEWKSDPAAATPIDDLSAVLRQLRDIPQSDVAHRRRAMNTFVRVLGEPENLATYLEIIASTTTNEPAARDALQRYKRFAHYGHYQLDIGGTGKTLANPTRGPDEWHLTMSVWQPLAEAASLAFRTAGRKTPNALSEPPHSHP